MKSIKLALVAILFASGGQLCAQDFAFKVLINKGKNELKSGETWQQVKVGSALQSHDEIKVAENSYIGLVHITGKPLELKQSGKYKVADLAAKVNNGPGVLNKYTDFILSTNTGPKTNLTATGAVNRGGAGIDVHLPNSSAVVYGPNVTISWEENKDLKPYVVVFSSMFGDELNVVETNDHFVTINLDDKNFLNEDNIIVKVSSKADPAKQSDDFTLKKLSKADKERIQKTVLQEIPSEMFEPSPLNKLYLGGIYEQNGLIIDATSHFLEAIRLAPDLVDLKDDYNAFLMRNHLKDPPVKK